MNMVSFRLAKKILLTNSVYKIIALIAGTSIWWMLGQTVGSSRWVTVPLAFYNSSTHQITGPDTIQVQLAGRRSDLYALDTQQLALHIDRSRIKDGSNKITVSSESLLLPDQINIKASRPSNVTLVTV